MTKCRFVPPPLSSLTPAAATLATHGATLLIERGGPKEANLALKNFTVFDADYRGSAQVELLVSSDGTRVVRPRVLGGGTAINIGIYNRDSADDATGVFAGLGYNMLKMEAAYNWTESILEPEPAPAPLRASCAAGMMSAFLADDANIINHTAPSLSLVPGVFQGYTTLPGPQSGRNRVSADMLVRQPNLNLTVLLKSAVTKVVFDASKRAVRCNCDRCCPGRCPPHATLSAQTAVEIPTVPTVVGSVLCVVLYLGRGGVVLACKWTCVRPQNATVNC